MRLHPRVFTALGKELVTNDVVAIMELVKNAYDAFAYNVELSFGSSVVLGQPWLEIQDDGLGMTRQVIEEAWCMVATPYRAAHSYVRRGNRERRVSGAKGLGRLAAARLGPKLTMLTQASPKSLLGSHGELDGHGPPGRHHAEYGSLPRICRYVSVCGIGHIASHTRFGGGLEPRPH